MTRLTESELREIALRDAGTSPTDTAHHPLDAVNAILDRRRLLAHIEAMDKQFKALGRPLSKKLEFALIAGKVALTVAADDASADSPSGDKCRQCAALIEQHLGAMRSAPSARCGAYMTNVDGRPAIIPCNDGKGCEDCTP
jgi:hypothetical protein